MQAILCDKIAIDVWRLRKVLAYEQSVRQLEGFSGSPVELSRREAIIYKQKRHASEWENLNQLKKWLTSRKTANLSDLSSEIHELSEEIVQILKQCFREVYRHMDVELLENCKQLSKFCTWNELDLSKFKADLLESIEDKLDRSVTCQIITKMASKSSIASAPYINL